MIDYEAEGLLAGLESGARAARLDLLQQLSAAGSSLDELRRAVTEGRLAVLPVERVLSAGARYTLAEVARHSGLPQASILAHRLAFGLSRPDAGDVVFTESDVDAFRVLKQLRDAGLPEEEMIEAARVLGQSLSRIAESVRTLVGEAFLRSGDTERDLGLRYAEAASNLLPLLGPLLENGLNSQLRELVATDVVDRAEMASGHLVGSVEVAVCFADMVGFTELGERLGVEEVGAIAGRLATMAGEVAKGRVRLIKTIGDAAMFASRDTGPLVDAALDLVAAAEAEGGRFPRLRAGIARGPALNRNGDWYGRTVNLASRVTGVAPAGSVVLTSAARETVQGGYEWSDAGPHRLKGFKGELQLLRVERCARRP